MSSAEIMLPQTRLVPLQTRSNVLKEHAILHSPHVMIMNASSHSRQYHLPWSMSSFCSFPTSHFGAVTCCSGDSYGTGIATVPPFILRKRFSNTTNTSVKFLQTLVFFYHQTSGHGHSKDLTAVDISVLHRMANVCRLVSNTWQFNRVSPLFFWYLFIIPDFPYS